MDDKELLNEDQFDSLMDNSEFIEARKSEYKEEYYVCQLMVTGSNPKASHYQVLVLNRYTSTIFLIEFSKAIPPQQETKRFIKKILVSFGWSAGKMFSSLQNQRRGV